MQALQRLTQHASLRRRPQLSTLMEESPPPVPPKSPKHQPRMEANARPFTAPASGSKRRREARVQSRDDDGDYIDPLDPDTDTPNKRPRSNRQSDASASEDAAPSRPRTVRRKKGSRNLSQSNLRHAAEQQDAHQRTLSRESKFQEGSLTDKPSDRPPSLFTRTFRPPSRDMDELMEDYHDGMPTPKRSVDHGNGRTSRASKQLLAENARQVEKDAGAGFFQFGRQWASTFHPSTLWRKLWNEPKDELVQQQIDEAERKARQKVEAEETYAQLKRSGQLGLQPVSRLVPGDKSEQETPRDSGIEIDGLDHTRSISRASGLQQPLDSESEVPDTASKPNKTLKSLHLKKPSLTNIKTGLKRVGSDLNLTATLHRRESSSSLSPLKTDFDKSTLRRAVSRYDLKKQQKLSQRVSDLETKLANARNELNDALVEASPAPRLTSRYERFVPSGTIKRPKFVPGKLPSLPSERILMADEAVAAAKSTMNNFEHERERQPRKAIDLTTAFDEEEDGGGAKNGTIKASRDSTYPTRASSLFNLDNQHIEKQAHSEPNTMDDTMKTNEQAKISTSEPAETNDMDANDTMDTQPETTAEPEEKADYASLDAKLKALDANSKRRTTKSKKRKSGAAKDDDKAFKPGRVSSDDDDDEWEEANPTPRKKRKSGGASSPPTKRSGAAVAKSSSPPARKKGGATANVDVVSSSPKGKRNIAQQPAEDEQQAQLGSAEPREEDFSPDEENPANDESPLHASLDSQGHPLDVVYEEEEETSKLPLPREPAKNAPRPTSSRLAGLRSRSNSPHKRSRSVQPAGTEETILTRAAEAVKASPARKGGSPPPPPQTGNGLVSSSDATLEIVTVKPGEGGVPKLPKGATGIFESLDGLVEVASGGAMEVEEETVIVGPDGIVRKMKGKASFEWPEDVF